MSSRSTSIHDKLDKHVELTNFTDGDSGNGENSDPLEDAALLSTAGIGSPVISTEDNQDDRNDKKQRRKATLQYARRLLYVSHLFAQFSEVSWQFCLTLFLAALTNYQSLFLVATYGLTTGTAVTLLGSATGSLVDRTNRLLTARYFICIENVCVILATLFCFQLLSRAGNSLTDMSSIILITGIHILGAAARVLDEGFLVAIERDWVVVMSHFVNSSNGNNSPVYEDAADENPQQFDSRAWLSETNVAMKQIDLSCKVAAPAISGILIAVVDNRSSNDTAISDEELNSGSQFRYAALAIGSINVVSLLVEYYCTTAIYESIPDLANLKHLDQREKDGDVQASDENGSSSLTIYDTSNQGLWATILSYLPYGARVYVQQKTAFAGIGLAMLYLNALTFDAIFTAYLVWRGMGLETIGIWRGISSAVGLLGTCAYHWSVKRMTLEVTGLWSIVYEFLCLSLSYSSLFVSDDDTSLVLLIAGVCLSRVGLWVFDIAVTQMMQENVPDGVRGVVGGVQQSLNAFFNLISYAIGVVVSDPSQFHVYVAAGYSSVGVAMLLYTLGTFSTKQAGTCEILRWQ